MSNLNIPNYEVSKIIENLIIFKPNVYDDYRGDNFEVYNNSYASIIEKETGHKLVFPTLTTSTSRYSVLRGFHSDNTNWKLVQCLYGSVYAVIIGKDTKSKVYLTLNDRNKFQILIPPQNYNAYLCLTDKCVYTYQWSYGYVPIEQQISKKWNEFGVYWPIKNPILSERDA